MRQLLVAVLALLFAGCEAMPERIRERFSGVPPQERVLEFAKPRVFEAAQEALSAAGYEVTRTAEAQGIIEAQSRVLPGEQFGGADQYLMEIRVRELDASATSVSALLTQHSEGDFGGGVSGAPQRAHGRYETFFEALEAELQRPAVETK